MHISKRSRLASLLCRLLLLLAGRLLLLPTLSQAQTTIVWGAAQNWNGTAAQVLANGVRHSAVCFVPGVDQTVNGVVFDRATVASGGSPILFANSSPVQITSGLHMTIVNAPSGFGSFGTLVSYGNFHLNAASTITIGSLVVGQDYQVQIFMPYWDQFYPTSFASASGASVTLNCGRVLPAAPEAAQFVTGTFTATATSHVINYLSAPTTDGYAGVSAVSVRRTSVSPTLVSNTNDNGTGSLRAAITYANATAGADTITFSDGTGGTVNFTDATPEIINLLTVLPDLSTDITITGPGADKLTILRPAAAATQFSIFFVNSSTATVNLSGLTLTGGNSSSSGGGIRNAGSLTVTACAITGNTAGINSGGGIFNFKGRLNVHSSTISGNSAGYGGGIYSSNSGFTATSTVTLLVNTTLSGNTASSEGGGFYNENGLSYLVNCTLTGNTAPANAGGGVATFGDSATVTRFANTLCVGNAGGGDVAFVRRSTNSNISLGGNLIGTGNSGASFTGQTTTAAASTILNTTLASNGGPTQTHALIPGSPALNAGVNTNATNPTDAIFGDANDVALTTDQRGSTFLRTIGIVDVGAFEQQAALTPPTLVTNVSDSGAGSLRAAITYANATAGADTITFSDGTGGTVNFTDATAEIIDLATVLPDLSTDITISGPGADRLTIRRPAAAASQFRIFHVSSATATVNLSGLTLTGGNAGSFMGFGLSGGGIYNVGTLTVTACTITGNTAGKGGGITSQGRLTVHSSTISGNSAGRGGGVYSLTSAPPFTATSTVTLLVNTTLSGNTATAYGGGFANDGGLCYLVNCTLTGNSAPANAGGGVATYGASDTVTRFANTLCVGNTGGGDVAFVSFGTNSNISLGGNLIGTGNSGANFSGQTTAAAASTILNPTLASNGGPTLTHALIPGSPALNAGVNANATNPTDAIFGDANDVALTTDQRGSGFLRTIGGTVDVGAFEQQTAFPSNNADLSALTTTAGTLPFVAATTTYTASVPNATTDITVTPTAAHPRATLYVHENGGIPSIVASGAASGNIPLNVGGNIIAVLVYAEDGTNKTYTISVQRAAAPPANEVTVAGTNLGLIPDYDATGREILFNITGAPGVVKTVSTQFTFNPLHAYMSDLRIQLIAPSGTSAWIYQPSDGLSNDLLGPYTIADTGTVSLQTAATGLAADATLASGTYRAATGATLVSLNLSFGGTSPNGTWKLRFVDSGLTDTTSVSQASLTLTTAGPGKTAIQRQTNGQMTLSLTEADTTANYDLMRSTDLRNWTLLQSKTTNGAGATTHTDPAPPANRGFYRYIPRP